MWIINTNLMAWKEKPIEKLYWSIGEVATELNMTTSAIRYYLGHFNIRVKRASNGDRLFTKEDVKLLHDIRQLAQYMHIKGIKRALAEGVLTTNE